MFSLFLLIFNSNIIGITCIGIGLSINILMKYFMNLLMFMKRERQGKVDF